MVRGGFTLIELIFAIVVISIAVVSLPMMNQATSKGIDANLVQEAIFAASTKLNEAVSAHWDENSMQDDKNSLARVIDVEDNSCNANHLRKGHIFQPLHRRCLNDSTTDAANSSDNDDVYALEDMQTSNEELSGEKGASGYKNDYNITTKVSYPAYFNGENNNNIKEINVTITSGSQTVTLLKTYSANIGEVDYYKKTYE